LTAERFILQPLAEGNQPVRLYRTGDSARWCSDGTIEFLGRADSQVKIRGYRVELGEIEAALVRHPGIKECAVLVHEVQGGEKRLLAYLVQKPGQAAPRTIELRRFLERSLPDFMLPSGFVFLAALPLTPNGKVDRQALPAPTASRPETEEAFVAAATSTQEKLAGIWREVLHLDRVGIHDDFFELGGHSLLVMQVISRVRDSFGLELSMRHFFEAPTIAGLAGIVDSKEAESTGSSPAITRRGNRTRAKELLDRLDQLSDQEIEQLLRDPQFRHSLT
jgi:acyl carrier protein